MATLLSAASMCGGCYPSIAVVRPGMDLTVREAHSDAADGGVIADARVTLATYSPEGPTFEYFNTDQAGRLKTRPKREPTVRVVLGDYFWDQRWSLCVEKPGYRATAVRGLSANGTIEVRLEPSPLTSTCEWPREYWDPPKISSR